MILCNYSGHRSHRALTMLLCYWMGTWAMLGAGATEVQVAATLSGWSVETILQGRDLRAFNWDSRGRLWVVQATGSRVSLGVVETGKNTVSTVHRFSIRLTDALDLVFRGETAFVAHGSQIERFDLSQATPRVFPAWKVSDTEKGKIDTLGQLSWGPDSKLYATRSSGGVGRLKSDGQGWEWFSVGAGNRGGLDWDEHGNLFVGDASGVYHAAPGITLGTIASRTDWGIPMEVPPVWGTAVDSALVYGGDGWPSENRGTIIVAETGLASLRQLRMVPRGASFHAESWRELARWKGGEKVESMRVGPDGRLWMLLNGRQHTALVRLGVGQDVKRPTNLSGMTSLELAGQLESADGWHRWTALQLLSERRDLPGSRGLHPGTRLHELLDKSQEPRSRLMALWALHGMGMLEDDHLGNTLKDTDPWVLAWLSRLAGERQYPTQGAFEVLIKQAKHTNAMVRSATLVGARQFVSGELVKDTPPVIPIREVFTGGIMSGLWFASLQAEDPVINQQYWNGLRPISAFDLVHPLGFFEDESKRDEPLGIFVIRKMTDQLARTRDVEGWRAGIRAVAKIHMKSTGYVRAALDGLLDGMGSMHVRPTREDAMELEKLRANGDAGVIQRLDAVLKGWGRGE